jgi:signal transduction histidine kinase/ActR/RegA family two-component response regulator
LPVFLMLGLGSGFAGSCFYRLRKKTPFVGAGMLALGFSLWGLYLAIYPFLTRNINLASAGFFAAAVLQLFIAISMIVLVLEEVRYNAEKVREEIAAVRSEKEALQVKVITTEKECHNLYDQVRLQQGVQRAYDELRRTQQVVVQQERLRALGQMASGIAHDVNNALSPVVGYSELLLTKHPDLPENARNYLKIINRSGDDIAHIVARMREFYRRRSDAEPLVQVNLNLIINEVIELTRPRWRDVAQRNGIAIEVQKELTTDLPLLWSEPSELREALTNLIFNSVDALPHGGVITLATKFVPDEIGEGQIKVEVRDNGIGMDESIRQRCMEPFFTTKGQRGGTGLGLAMVYGMIQRHDGVIDIESSPGRGTCIRLAFPVRKRISSGAQGPAAQNKPERTLNILCIDDEEHIRQLLNDCLGYFNHRVTLAATGREGLELFRAASNGKNPYEVVITDLGMPDIDGNQVARQIKSTSPRTPIVMITGWGTAIRDNNEAAPEVDALVNKPPHIHQLNSLLLRLTDPDRQKS